MGSRTRVLGVGFLPAAIVFATAGCPGGDSAVNEARRVRDQRIGESAEHRRFDIEISRGATDPVRREQLVHAIADDRFAIASLALDTLAAAPPAEARDALRQVFDGKSGVLKLRAAVALGRLGDEAAVAFLREQIRVPEQTLGLEVVTVLAAHGGEPVLAPVFAPRLASDDRDTREEAYALLGAVRAPWATDLLLRGLEREHGEERRAAIQALGRTGEPRVASAIERFVNTKGLVFATLEALGAVGSPDGADAVRSMLASAEPTVRAYAAVALWRLGGKSEAEPVVSAGLTDADASARAVLAEQLAPVADPDARRYLAVLALDTERTVRVAALRSMAAEPRVEDLNSLLAAAGDADYQLQTIALGALARAGGPEAAAAIRPLVRSENPYVALAAAHAVVEITARAKAA